MRRQQGQILVMAAMMMVVLVGVVGLAVDLGQIYAIRRSLQNAADVAALVGSVKLPDAVAATSAAQASASANVPGATVQVHVPAQTLPAVGSYSDPTIEVAVSEEVPHLYAVLFGRSSSTIGATAIALRRSPVAEAVIVALSDSDDRAIDTGGSGEIFVPEGDVWSNDGVCARGSGSLTVDSPGTISAVGGFTCGTSRVSGTMSQPGAAIGDPLAGLPPPPAPAPGSCTRTSCNTTGVTWQTMPTSADEDAQGWRPMQPGFYHDINLSNSRKYKFLPGVYFVEGNLNLQGQVVGVANGAEDANAAFALDEPNTDHPWGGVSFFIYGSSSWVKLEATAQVKLAADDTNYQKILLWVANGSTVTLNGGGDTRILGTVYAPNAHIQIAGHYGDGEPFQSFLEGRMIGDTIEVTGGSECRVGYSDEYAAPVRKTGILVR